MTSNPPRDRRAASGARAGSGGRGNVGGRGAGSSSAGGQSRGSGGRGRSSGRSGRGGSSGAPKGRPKSIVAQKKRPWGMITAVVAVIVFAALILGFAVYRANQPHVNAADANYVRPEIAAAKAIDGVKYKAEPDHTHVTTAVKYNTSPPTGGDHSQFWADCSGTVYPNQIANENAVHPLEHGAVWITYRPGLAAADIATLAKLVTGQNGTFMTPYAGLKTPISLQAWDYQLFVARADDPRIAAFIKALRLNPGTTPEFGASCSNAAFKANPSTLGHPTYQ